MPAEGIKALLLGPLWVAVLAVHILWADDDYPLLTRLCAGIVGCITVWLFMRKQRSPLPGLPFVAIQFWMFMGRPVFKRGLVFGVRGPFAISPESWELAGISTVVALIAVLIGAFVGERVGIRTRRLVAAVMPARLSSAAIPRPVARSYAAAALALQAILHIRPDLVPAALTTPADTVSTPALLIGILFIDARQRGDVSGRVWLYSAVLVQAATGLATGMLGGALLPAAAVTLYEWTERRRLPWVLIVLGAVVYVVLTPAKEAYRRDTWGRGYVTIDERASSWVEAIANSWTVDSDDSLSGNMETAADRVTAFPYVALAFEAVPHQIPFAGPERWFAIPSLMIPRVFWPAKPKVVSYFNEDYTLTFGLQTSEMTRTTAVNLPMITDGYWRLGWLGIVIEGVVLGGWLGWLIGTAVTRNALSLLLCVTLLTWVRPDGYVAGLVCGLPSHCIGVFLALWALELLCMLAPHSPLGTTALSPSEQTATRAIT